MVASTASVISCAFTIAAAASSTEMSERAALSILVSLDDVQADRTATASNDTSIINLSLDKLTTLTHPRHLNTHLPVRISTVVTIGASGLYHNRSNYKRWRFMC